MVRDHGVDERKHDDPQCEPQHDGRRETVTDELDASPWPAEEPVAIEVRRGTLVVLHGLLPHASSANRSDRPRHAYALHLIDRRAAYSADNWLQRPNFPLRGFS